MVRVWQGEEGSQHAESLLVTDDLACIDAVLAVDSSPSASTLTDLLSPISYGGISPRMDMAHKLFAPTFDLHYIQTATR